MAYSIRPFIPEDAPAIARVTLAAIAVVGAHSYSDKQVRAWAARHPGPERFIQRLADGAKIWVAADPDDVAVAYALLEYAEDGAAHLDMLYCDPDHTRKGLAGELLAAAEQAARAQRAPKLFTEASELARAAFERAGYSVTHRRDFTIEHHGRVVPIHNYAMEKRLI
ncbi:MAG: GNAT family N-acetyltransferase [Erythrobacter sp.]